MQGMSMMTFLGPEGWSQRVVGFLDDALAGSR